MPDMATAVSCFLCKVNVPFTKTDRSEIVAHLEEEHAVTYGTDYLVAGCTMDDQERVAIQNVVKGRQPKLIQLEAKNSGDGKDGVSKTPNSVSVTKLASPSKALDPKKKKCPDCDFTYMLQIQMNRHAMVCSKKKATESPKIKKWKIKVRGDLQEKSPNSAVGHPDGKMKKPKISAYVEPGKGHPCKECGKEFRSEANMLRHHEDLHQPGEFPCPGDTKLCGKVFTSRNKMSSHYSRNCNPNNPAAVAVIEKRRASLGSS